MTLLHDYFNTRNLQAFQRLLDGSNERGSSAVAPSSSGGPGSSYTGSGGGGKSWNRSGGVMHNVPANNLDVNAKDWLGRTVLHLACASLESIEYARALLKHANTDVNLPDTESMWTPLHRALYSANLPVALLLLQRSDIDTTLKDLEGYTAIDLYNSTVNGTKPDPDEVNAELFTWGTNKNAALGLSDADDRVHPDHVVIKPKEESPTLSTMTLAARFHPNPVRQIHMSKLHTVVVTGESEGNLRVCGFGSGGRLGSSQHMQYSLIPLPSFNLQVQSVAVGQDHTLALTTSGDVYSWGLNRFSQLGYIVELSSTATARHEEPIQSVPKRVVGPLRREVVCGVAAGKNASACWTKDTVFTWGTNTGQLGYDKNAQPVQILPRPVTKFSNVVIDLAMSDTVLVALLVTHHVECIWNDRHFRISFPMHAFPMGIEPYRPPQSIRDSWISKVTCCDDTFAALSSNGEVFTFSSPNSNADVTSGDGRSFKPQRIWALRKKFSAVKDVALGSDGSIIICTESGHVFVCTRNVKSVSGKAFKFDRVPFLQRVTRVCANSSGAFGALRVDYKPKPIEVLGNMISQDLRTVQPYLEFYRDGHNNSDGSPSRADRSTGNGTEGRMAGRRARSRSVGVGDLSASVSLMVDGDEPEDASIETDIFRILELCDVLVCEQRMRKVAGGNVDYNGIRLPHGADAMVHVQACAFPVHSVMLAARSDVLRGLLGGGNVVRNKQANLSVKLLPAGLGLGSGISKLTRLAVTGCHPLTVLIFLRYIYSDELLAVWDRRICTAAEAQLSVISANPTSVKTELQVLAKLLELPALEHALEPPVKREPAPTMAQDMRKLFDAVQTAATSSTSITTAATSSRPKVLSSPPRPDVVLLLADREVYCHSIVLRARSPLFTSFFDLEDWTAKRRDEDGMVHVNMKHMKWHVLRFVMGFMCCGEDAEMFYVLDFVNSVEGLVQFMFEVLAAANELLLDRLVLLCSSVILAHTNINNACYVLADASHYHVQPLVEKLQEYISVNMETFLENRILDEIPYALVKQLAKFVTHKQTEKSPFSRSDAFAKAMLEKHADWLAREDIPEVIVKASFNKPSRRDFSAAKISPPIPAKNLKVSQKSSMTSLSRAAPEFSPRQLRRPPSGDDIFAMDDADASATPAPPQDEPSFVTPMPMVTSPVWKAHGVPRVDMKAVMAEAASQNQPSPFRHPSIQSLSHSPRPMATRSLQTPNDPSGSTTPSKPLLKQPSGSGTPMNWRTNVDQSTVRGGFAPSTPPTASAFVVSGSGSPKDSFNVRPAPGPSKVQSTPTTPGRNQPPGLGPVITPTRQTSSKSGSSQSHHVRSAVGSKAWSQSQPPTQPVPAPTAPTKGVSFVAIQHSQQEQVAPVKDKRSLREIQEEERALQAEADFLIWWTAEEKRVQQEVEQETLALAQFQNNLNNNASTSTPGRKPRNTRPKGLPKSKVDPAAPGNSDAGQSTPQNVEARPAHTPKKQPRKPRQKSHADP